MCKIPVFTQGACIIEGGAEARGLWARPVISPPPVIEDLRNMKLDRWLLRLHRRLPVFPRRNSKEEKLIRR